MAATTRSPCGSVKRLISSLIVVASSTSTRPTSKSRHVYGGRGHDGFPVKRLAGAVGSSTSRRETWTSSTRARMASTVPPRSAWWPTWRKSSSFYVEQRQARSVRPSLPPREARVFEYRGEIVTVPAKKGDPREPDRKCEALYERIARPGRLTASQSRVFPMPRVNMAAACASPGRSSAGRADALKGAGFYEWPVWLPGYNTSLSSTMPAPCHWIDLAIRSGRARGRRAGR